MSHFTVLVLGDNVDEQLAPYDENLQVEPYLDTEEDEWREHPEKAKALNADPERLAQFSPGNNHHFPEGATDQQILDWWSGRGVWIPREDREGWDKYSTYSRASKWDWYTVGGRWDRMLVTKEGETTNQTTVGELNLEKTFPPEDDGTRYTVYAYVKDGQWHEKGQMGWFGMSSNDRDDADWNNEVLKVLAEADPDTQVTLIDAHI